MPAGQGILGRAIIFKWNGAKIGGVREKSLAINGEPINVSDDDSSGYREILEEDGEKMIDIGLSGVTKNDILRRAKMTGGAATIGAVTLEYPDGAILSGDFKLVNYNETEPYNDATTFESSLQSTGAYSYIPAP